MGAQSLRKHGVAGQLLAKVEEQGYRCALTGRDLSPEDAVADHVIALSRDGEHSVDNIQIVHTQANAAKGVMTNEEFISLCRDVVAWADASA